MISGLQLAAYWIGNYIFDILYLQTLVSATIICFFMFDSTWKVSLIVFATWPFAIVVFLYGFSFFFKNASNT